MRHAAQWIAGAALVVGSFGVVRPLAADTVRLRTGEVLVGTIRKATYQEIEIDAQFPEARRYALRAAEVAPSSIYAVLATRLDRSDGEAGLKLARWCLGQGLYAYAELEADRVGRAYPALSVRALELLNEARGKLAAELLAEARTYLAIDQPERAAQYLRSVVKRYAETPSAKEAKRLLARVPEAPRAKAGSPLRRRTEVARARRSLKAARAALAQASAPIGHIAPGGRGERGLRVRIARLERALALVAKPARRGAEDEVLAKALRETAATAKARLIAAYLELGTLYLTRGAIAAAEVYCGKACRLDPTGRSTHKLHERIIDARIRLRFGDGF